MSVLALSFQADTHKYFLSDNIELPSQSRILDWAGFVTPYPQGDYKERGTAVHYATLLLDQGRLGKLDPRIEGYVNGYKKFLHDFPEARGAWDSSEEPKYHETLMYAGTADRVRKGKRGRKKLVLDIKTGTPPQKRLQLQLALYVMLHFEDFKDVGRWGLQLFPDGDYRLMVCENIEDYPVAEGIVRRYHWEKS
jgi:hypothetical protein